MIYKKIESPIGILTIFSSGKGICRIDFENENPRLEDCEAGSDLHIEECVHQVDLYFKKELKEFNLKLDINGTEFQKAVWNELLKIPYGELNTYGQIAKDIGKPNASRAVGQALNKNPIPIVIPCHRVIGADGSLTGFGGGLRIKEFLLEHEDV